MWSKYLRTRERDGVVAVFHELHPVPVYVSTTEWNAIKEGGTSLKSEFIQKGLWIDSPEDDSRAFAEAETRLLAKLGHVTILYLMTAQGCDFDCGYCPVPGIARRYGASFLSVEAARAGIDLWLQHLADALDETREYYVIFYGGEPLLNKPVIFESLRYLDELKADGRLPRLVRYMVTTNGAGVDQDFVEACLRHDVSVAVGLDGERSSNDVLKVDVHGLPTYDRIVDAIRLLSSSGVPTYASCSVTPFNMESVPRMGAFFKELGVLKFGFNFLRGRKLVELVGANGVEAYYRKASHAVIEQARHQDAGFEFQMEKKALAYRYGDFFPLDCTCHGSQLVIQPDGQVSNCPFHKARLGEVTEMPADFRIGSQPIVNEWRKRLPIYHDGFAKALSGGGCAWGAVDLNGRPSATDIGSRIFAEEVLDEFIWRTYRERATAP